MARRLLNAPCMRNIALASILICSSAYAAAPVVGGTAVKPGEWPEVALVVAPQALCSGTLIAPDLVLTAGHCIETHPFEVIIGTIDFSKPGGERIPVANAIAYPNWQHAFDVGVLVLAHPSAAKPRELACGNDLKSGSMVHVVGFGLTSATGKGDNSVLHEADMKVTDAACTRMEACNPAIAPDGELAAGGLGTDSCFGDSGGPAFLKTAAGTAVLGVVSRGTGTSSEPCSGGGIYERADRVAAWIEKTTHRTLSQMACDGKADDPARESTGVGCSAGGELTGGGLLVLLVGALWVYNSRACRKSR
jgi:secreted trypsin-like serine protease